MNNGKSAVEAVLNGVANAVKSGATPEEVCGLLYSPDMIVVGEGMEHAVRGNKEFLPVLAEILNSWGPGPDLYFSVLEPVIEGGQTATTLVNLRVVPADKAAPADHLRIIYAWVLTGGKWRVAAEMYTLGSY